MKIIEENFFVPYPKFFENKDHGIEVYNSFDAYIEGIPIFFNIIFTQDSDLEKVKEIIKSDWERAKALNYDPEIKLTIKKLHECLCNRKPEKSRFFLSFIKGSKEEFFNESNNKVDIFIDNDVLPDASKAWFFPSDNYPMFMTIIDNREKM